jgi:hypothetical protein
MRTYDAAGVNRLRFVFEDTVFSLGVAADATFADVAEALVRLSGPARRSPIAIDVTVAANLRRFQKTPVRRGRRRRPAAAHAG